ncbi:spore germination protein GerW family protein [Cellulomonas edaphi]|uniref:Spore germination protein GerW family protein n=1 Tax=Cellulomonas edaphi TaxID=3053468 RepID=A0ABT7S8N2_9CELL|nr:spore germination protein GerW family protein [Cellulomons edaphi]MDM7831988.1 spore germination protein GerW family protein [Cellulomons edaphi]
MSETPRFDAAHLTNAVSDTVTVRRVFGEAYESHGSTVIPVARVWAATGMGMGDGEGGLPTFRPASEDGGVGGGTGNGHGGGGGYGVHVKAVGVYVVDDEGVRWQPSLDVNRVILGGQAVGAAVLSALALAWAVRGIASQFGRR